MLAMKTGEEMLGSVHAQVLPDTLSLRAQRSGT